MNFWLFTHRVSRFTITYIAPLGLWIGQDARPTGAARFEAYIAPLGL